MKRSELSIYLAALLAAAWLLPAGGPALAQCAGLPSGNLVCASPNGAPGLPGFRAMVAGDLPGGGAAGGSLTGTYPNPTIANSAISNAMLSPGAFTSITGLGTVTSGTLNGLTITGLANPSGNSDAANKAYVDAATTGVTVHPTVVAATTAVLSNTPTYANGSSGVGATLTAGSNGALTVDGHAVANGERVLVKDQAAGLQNGVYTQTTLGTGGAAYVLTRAVDMDTVGTGPTQMETNATFLVTSGSANVGGNFALTTLPTITIGTTALTFTQNGASQVYAAGTGLTLVGTTFSLTAPVTVMLGGTGATTLSGLLQGNGTSAVTALTGTSGGVPYFSASTTVASSGVLAANGLVLGGGAGAAPATMARLTAGQLAIGQSSGAPVAAVLSGDVVNSASGATTIQNNAVGNAKMAQAAAATLKGNPTGSTANVQDFTPGALTQLVTPDANLDLVVIYNHLTGALNYVTPGAIATTATSGIPSIGGLTGAFSCGTTISCAGNILKSNAQPVDIRDFGAVANVSTGSTPANNAAAFVAALTASGSVVCPAGFTFYTATVDWPSNGKHLQLDCAVVAAGAYGGNTSIFSILNQNQGILIEGVGSINAAFSTYPGGVNGFALGLGGMTPSLGSSNVTIRGLTFVEISYAVYMPALVSNIKFLNNVVNFNTVGFRCEIGCSDSLVDGNRFFAVNGRDSGLGVQFSSEPPNVQASNITITNNQCDLNSGIGTARGGWCYTVQNGKDFIISNNVAINNYIEAITAYGSNGTVRGNVINTSLSDDLGISIGPLLVGCICDNVVNGAHASGIVLVNATNQFVTVTGNTIVPAHPAQVPAVCVAGVPNADCATLPVSGTVYQEGWACIAMDHQSSSNAIYGNTCLDPFNGDMYWNLLYLDTYASNYYGPNFGAIGVSGYSGWQAVATAAHAAPNYSPAISPGTCGGGSPFLVGSEVSGVLIEGTSATGCTLQFKNITSTHTWSCVLSPQSPLSSFSYVLSAGFLVLSHGSASGTSINYLCNQQLQ